MTTAIDVGNSAVKVARVTADELAELRRLPTAGGPDPGALGRLLADDTDAVAVVSVVPAWTEAVARAVASTGRPLLQATHETIPLPVRLPSPATVGADRLLGAWAAREQVGAPCIVVDVGTATTIDVVDAGGGFVGGAILPGPALAMRSLARGTALLPPVPLEPPERAIGRDTIEAIASGVLLGHRDAIGGLIVRMAAELGVRPTVVLTGGDAAALGSPDWADRVEPELLLRGLGSLVGATVGSHA
ncbi:MAG: type III pantothenate kinase [Chloroflexota bacterium]